MPSGARSRTAAAQFACEQRPECADPAPDGLVGHIKPALRQEVLHIAVAQSEAQIQPDRVPNDGWRVLVASKGNGGIANHSRAAAPPGGFPVTTPNGYVESFNARLRDEL